MVTFDQFEAHLNTLHERAGDETMMYNIAKDLGGGVFAYSYDALCTQVLRFNEDGSVDEWCEADYSDHEHYEPHFSHASVEVWMTEQLLTTRLPPVS